MKKISLSALSLSLALMSMAQTMPGLLPIPVGEEAYLQWDKWYMQRIGVRTYMRSTYDRSGGNESADASHFLFMKGAQQSVALDVEGRGAVYFIRTNHWHGSPWHYIVDGIDNMVKETGTSDPVHARTRFDTTRFEPASAFPAPLAFTWSTTKGADLVWLPIAFDRSFQLAYDRTRYGTGYYIYQLYANKEQLSKWPGSWNRQRRPSAKVLALLSRAGTDIAPKNILRISGAHALDSSSLVIADIHQPHSVIRAIKLTIPLESAINLEHVRIQMTWDDAPKPSVDAPLCLFFGAGTLYNRDKRQYLVKGFPINIRYDYVSNRVELCCYYPMPFHRSARISLRGIDPQTDSIKYEVRYEPAAIPEQYTNLFHANYTDVPRPVPGQDLVFLDTKNLEGYEKWSGHFVGMSFIFSHQGNLNTLEGDPRFFFDDSNTPQAYGTGTEEWAGGGDYWGGQNMTLPLAGHPVGAANSKMARNANDLIESGYRFLLADLMPFGNRARICLEHGGENLSTDHYEAVCYWYGMPSATLVCTDSIDVGNASSEHQHAFHSPQASATDTIVSRYEWGIDSFPLQPWGLDTASIIGYSTLAGKEVFAAQREDGRHTRGTSTFVIHLDRNNLGVLLRRTLDYSFPNQRAKVWVSADTATEHWIDAGTWYLAGSNTCVYSDPAGELDKRQYRVQTSDRRLRDDEFLIPAGLTHGKEFVKVRIRFSPRQQDLFPGHPFPRQGAWSELKYQVYCYVLPGSGNP